MNSRRLQHFLAVYEHRSFGRAAAEVNVTQPALSKSVQLLEDELGVQLFERTASGAIPTIYGDALAQHAKVIQAEMRNAAREIATLSGAEKGEVRIGATPSVCSDVLPRAFQRLKEFRPLIRLRIIEGLMEDHIPALRRGELDVFIGGWVSGAHPDLTTELIVKDTVGIFAGPNHPLAEAEAVTLTTLVEQAWILPPPTQFWLHMVEQAFVSEGLTAPLPHAVSNSAAFIKAMLRTGRFLSALPTRLMRDELADEALVSLNVPDLKVVMDVTATYRRHAIRLSAFELFMRILRQVGKDDLQA